VKALDAAAHVILKMVGYVMNFAPLGVFGAIASRNSDERIAAYSTFYGQYLLYFLIGIAFMGDPADSWIHYSPEEII
jgi:Na+/H+-dicarboxylate symporter